MCEEMVGSLRLAHPTMSAPERIPGTETSCAGLRSFAVSSKPTPKAARMSRRPFVPPIHLLAAIALLSILAAPVLAMPIGAEGWTVLQGEAGASVDFPSALFPVEAGPTERGRGKKFRSRDGTSEFAVYSLENRDKDSPAAYLRK
ncbi:MAG: hypothetical protein F9K41_17385, partial [Sphingopyxis terrae]